MVMQRPQPVAADEHDVMLDRVAAVDVGKAAGKVCLRVPDPAHAGRRATSVWDVVATTKAILELADHLAERGQALAGLRRVGAGTEAAGLEHPDGVRRLDPSQRIDAPAGFAVNPVSSVMPPTVAPAFRRRPPALG